MTLEPDTVVHPFTMLRGATSVAEGAEIGPHAVVIDAEIGPAATVGPFCYVRPGNGSRREVQGGTFVEIKNTRLDEDAKVPHLSYFGDAEVGAGTNIGAGSITANFDHRPGVPKKRTVIGANARVAVDTMFVAPVIVGDDVWTAAVRSSRRMSRTTLSSGSRRGRRSRRVEVESGTVEQTLPGLGVPDMPAPGTAVGRDIGLTPNKRLLLVVGPLQSRAGAEDRASDRLRARRVTLKTFASGETYCATRSRSAARTSSSCRRLRCPSTRT